MKTGSTNILVTGDYIIDFHIIRGERISVSSRDAGTKILKLVGGANLVYQLLNELLDDNQFSIANDPRFQYPQYTSYLEWSKHNKTNSKDLKKWDVVPLGYGNANPGSSLNLKPFLKEEEIDTDHHVLVIDEAGIGFSDNAQIKSFNNDIIIHKITHPTFNTDLWNRITGLGNELFTIVKLDNLRKYDIKVSNGISWEQTALDLAFELIHNMVLKQLLRCKNLVVLIGSSGAMYVRNGEDKDGREDKAEFHLVFDPVNLEHEWEQQHGDTVGGTSFFVSGFARSIIREYAQNKNALPETKVVNIIIKAIKSGLNLQRALKVNGLIWDAENEELPYPVEKLREIKEDHLPYFFSTAPVPSPYWNPEISYLKNSSWTILENNYFDIKRQIGDRSKPFYSLARDFARIGHEALQYAPKIQFGGMISYDRSEIEGLRNIKKLMSEYESDTRTVRPLNIAVFGPPGSGKSFAVKQIAKSVIRKKAVEFFTFNLSQFKNVNELPGAFHSIRDAVLENKLPIVFWDEFDSGAHEWLLPLIAPMQDGVFQDGKQTHPIGKCIFIFAGGTSYEFNHFGPGPNASEPEITNFKLKKGPDFISRINAYLNVLGPNRKLIFNQETNEWEGDSDDVSFPLRRALFIRNVLGVKEELKMDWGLLSAFIEISNYKNGSRSLSRILDYLKINGNDFIRSKLPSDEVLAMNVDYEEFMKLMYRDRSMEKFAETNAWHIHKAWTENKAVIYNKYCHEYGQLAYDMRVSNIHAAMRIKDIIERVGKFDMDKLETKPDLFIADLEDYINDPANLEALAEEEHKGWMEEKTRSGWVYGEKRSDYHRIHDCLKPFSEVDEGITDREKQTQKNKDREAIKNYPEHLRNLRPDNLI